MSLKYPWLESTWKSWQSRLENGRVPNAILVDSLNGYGADHLVELFSNATMCQNYESEACGFCHSCLLMQSGTHPDTHLVSPEKDKKSISVDQIRLANRWAQESSQLGGKRIIVINPAETMNEAAANALLKALEEAASSCIFVLLSSAPHKLLKTILSRCQRWSLEACDIGASLSWLQSQTDAQVSSEILKLSYGAPLNALTMINEGSIEAYKALSDTFIEFISNGSWDTAAIASLLKDNSQQQLEWLWLLLSDTQKVHFGLQNESLLTGANELAKHLDYQLAYKQTEKLRTMINQLEQFPGLNLELLLTDWLLGFK
ncbi:DNA polymerase III subunit delta' [Vibrio maerlii]|uniref:DNA polymerase III subunit delta' n=1 Tax=Vibrio maerlii TaxID=2231648 RepID=UPI000E3BCA0D|nr:DNA polymerase III subunit delta' [Vibrio maerlii]